MRGVQTEPQSEGVRGMNMSYPDGGGSRSCEGQVYGCPSLRLFRSLGHLRCRQANQFVSREKLTLVLLLFLLERVYLFTELLPRKHIFQI